MGIKLFKVFVAIGLTAWLIGSGRLQFAVFKSSSIYLITVFGVSVLFVSHVLRALCWWWLLRVQHIKLPLWQAFQLSWIGNFFSMVLPGGAGGELVRACYIGRESSVSMVTSISTVVVDRIVGLYALIWVGVISLLCILVMRGELTWPVVNMGAWMAGMVIGSTLLFLILWGRRTRDMVVEIVPARFRDVLHETIDTYQSEKRVLVNCFALSLAANLLAIGAFLLACKALDLSLGWWQVYLVGSLVTIANNLPLSPGGVGVGEATASILFFQFGLEAGAIVMVVIRFWLLIVRLPGGLMYVLRSRPSIEQLCRELSSNS